MSTVFIKKADLHKHPRLEHIYNVKSENEKFKLITVSYCSTCGFVEWLSSSPDGEEGLQLENYDPGDQRPCPRCSEVFRRNPEVIQWVFGVMHAHGINPTEFASVERLQ